MSGWRRALVTGAGGFSGSQLVQRVLEPRWPVRGFHVREAWVDIGSEADCQRAVAAPARACGVRGAE